MSTTCAAWVRMNISRGTNKFNIEHRRVIAVIGYLSLRETFFFNLSVTLARFQKWRTQHDGLKNTWRFLRWFSRKKEKHYDLCSRVVSPYKYPGLGGVGIRNTSRLKGYLVFVSHFCFLMLGVLFFWPPVVIMK